MLSKYYILSFLCFLFVTIGCDHSVADDKTEITVSAAASLKDALEDIKGVYEQQKEIELLLNFAASGTLSKQIEQGAPVDVFISASNEEFASLVDKKLIKKGNANNLLKNELVLIASPDSKISSLKDIDSVDKIAIGIPETVPAGKYAKESFESIGIWRQTEKRIILAKDVRQVLSYVETGNVSLGVVYKTDALTTENVKIVETIATSTHSPIVYPVGIINTTTHLEEAEDFHQFLKSDEAVTIFKKYGFTTID